MIFDKSPSLSVRWIPFFFFLCLGDDEKINQKHQLCWNSILHVSLILEHSSLFLLHTIPFLNQGTKFTLWSLVFHITDNGMWMVSSFSYRYITKSVVSFLFFLPFLSGFLFFNNGIFLFLYFSVYVQSALHFLMQTRISLIKVDKNDLFNFFWMAP